MSSGTKGSGMFIAEHGELLVRFAGETFFNIVLHFESNEPHQQFFKQPSDWIPT